MLFLKIHGPLSIWWKSQKRLTSVDINFSYLQIKQSQIQVYKEYHYRYSGISQQQQLPIIQTKIKIIIQISILTAIIMIKTKTKTRIHTAQTHRITIRSRIISNNRPRLAPNNLLPKYTKILSQDMLKSPNCIQVFWRQSILLIPTKMY